VTVPDDFFRLVVERTAWPFAAVDEGGAIRFVGNGVEELLGWRPEDLVGRDMLDFVPPDDVATALAALAEVLEQPGEDAGIPLVLPLRAAGGRTVAVELAAMPLGDHPDLGLIALRLRSWEPQRLLDEALRQLLANSPLPAVLEPLACSIAASIEGTRVSIHWGFDGDRFLGVVGSWPGAADLPLDQAPWTEPFADGDLRVLPGRWLKRIETVSVPTAVLTVWTEVERPLLGHRAALTTAAGYVELAIVRTAEHQRLLHLAGHDSLTGVANRAMFRDRLVQALATGEPDLAVGFCDLDGFKSVNDRWGHTVGDDVLVQVAERLEGSLRLGDELARLGGDEFTVLWRRIPNAAALERVTRRLHRALEAPFDVPDGAITLGLSIGVVLAGPGATADSLLVAADQALYDSKRAGGAMTTVAS
jgi:diguanylate cyclase (GGDEF)-like protein/PAS domain S-box-containing protein